MVSNGLLQICDSRLEKICRLMIHNKRTSNELTLILQTYDYQPADILSLESREINKDTLLTCCINSFSFVDFV